ncbi:hypothetical protein [Comamonas sp. MYb69]|uniref:hypothetical protein n=1 Tax=Comamonas sp. MYb69 TaxID=1848650 RepID=UPI00309E9770
MNEVAIRRAFLLQADQLVKQFASPLNIVSTVSALEAAINTMVDEPMRLLLVTADEAVEMKEKAGIDL